MILFAIPAKNEEKNISHAINSIHKSAKKLGLKYQISLCDNNSTDKTAQIATKLGAKTVFLQEPNISMAKNTAAKALKSDIIVFLDADTQITPELLQKALTILKNPKIKAVSCLTRFKKYPSLMSRGVWFYNFFSYFFRLGAGHFMVVKTKEFNQIKGFDTKIFAYEDIELFKRFKKNFGFNSVKVLAAAITTSNRKFEKKQNFGKFLLGLIGASLGFKVGKNKENLDFWYGEKANMHKERKNLNKFIVFLTFFLLMADFFGLNGQFKTDPIAQNLAILTIFILATIILLKSPFELLFLPILLAIEHFGVLYKIPFGEYVYSSSYWQIWGVPIFIPFAWYVIAKSTYLGLKNIVLAPIFIVAFDVFLEEFAVKKSIWNWAEHNGQLIAPYQNYISWFFISLVMVSIFKKFKLVEKIDGYHSFLNFLVIGTYIALSISGGYTIFGLIIMAVFGFFSLILASSRI